MPSRKKKAKEQEAERTIVVADGACPYCNKSIVLLKKIKVITPSVKAEKEESFKFEKSTQAPLDRFPSEEGQEEKDEEPEDEGKDKDPE